MKHFNLLLLAFFLLAMQQLKAAETEPNNSKAEATILPLNGNQTGAINVSGDEDWYKLTTNADGKINVSISTNGIYIRCYLYDVDGTTQLASGYTSSNTTISYDGAASGIYYIKLIPYYSGQLPVYTLSNSLTLPAQANDIEPNGSRAQALTLPLNGSKEGHVGYYYNQQRDTADWYKVTTNANGQLRVSAVPANGQYIRIYLYDNDGTTLLNSQYSSTNATVYEDGLAAGTYYVKIFSYYNYGFEPYTLSDSLFKPAQTNDNEPNDSRAEAITLPLNGSKEGQVGYYYNHQRDTADWYKVTTNADGLLKVSAVPANGQYIRVYLYDNNGTTLLNSDYSSSNANLQQDGLAAGTYYVKVFSYYNYGFEPYTLSDSLLPYDFANDAEPNGLPYQAKTILANGATGGHVGFYYNNNRDTSDWHKINYTGTGNLDFSINLEPLKIGNQNHAYFKVYKDTSASPIHSSYSSAGSRTVNLTNLTPGYYWIKIHTYYNYDFVSYSFTNSFTQTDIANIQITNATQGGCTGGQLQMQGSGSNPPYTVRLYRFGTLYGTYITNQTGGYTASNLPPGKYYATAFGDGASGSAFGKSNTVNLLPPATANTSERNINAVRATLGWNKVTCANGYYVQYRVQGNTQWVSKIVLGNKDSLRITGLAPNTTYQWRVAVGVGIDTISNYVLSAFTAIDQFTTAASFASEGTLNQKDVTVFPNPATTQFTININSKSTDKVSAWLKDASGNVHWNISNVNIQTLNSMQVNVSNLKPGIYYLQVGNANNLTNQKVVINR